MRTPVNRYRSSLLLVLVLSLVAISAAQEVPTVCFEGRQIRFITSERPYPIGHTWMVSLRAICSAMGANFHKNRESTRWDVNRTSDQFNYQLGDRWYYFNGARKDLPIQPEVKSGYLFVPFDVVETFSGGTVELRTDVSYRKSLEIVFRNRTLRFRADEAPFRQGNTVFVALKPTAIYVGALVDGNVDRTRLTITRSLDRVVYDQGQRYFNFNGAQKSLGNPSVLKGRQIFVPLELLQALVGDELRAR